MNASKQILFVFREHLSLYRSSYLSGAVILIVAGSAVVLGLKRSARAMDTTAWSERAAVITASTISEKITFGETGASMSLAVEISYRYTVNGKEFETRRWLHTPKVEGFPYKERLRKGEKITIRIDPDTPSRSVVTGPITEL